MCIRDRSKAVQVSTSWAKRCKIEFGNNHSKGLFGIVQGGLFKDLRTESIEKLIDIGFNGYAMGGLAVGEKQEDMFEILSETVDAIEDWFRAIEYERNGA